MLGRNDTVGRLRATSTSPQTRRPSRGSVTRSPTADTTPARLHARDVGGHAEWCRIEAVTLHQVRGVYSSRAYFDDHVQGARDRGCPLHESKRILHDGQGEHTPRLGATRAGLPVRVRA